MADDSKFTVDRLDDILWLANETHRVDGVLQALGAPDDVDRMLRLATITKFISEAKKERLQADLEKKKPEENVEK